MTGTITLVTADRRRTPPKITAPVSTARLTPMTHGQDSSMPPRVKVSPQLATTDSEMEFDCTALNTKPYVRVIMTANRTAIQP